MMDLSKIIEIYISGSYLTSGSEANDFIFKG